MESGYYPPGAEFDNSAPYNQIDLPEKEIEVTISVTLSKTVKITINDYKIEHDEEGSYYDYSECDFYKAVEEQITLPHELAEFTERMFNEHSANLKAIGMPRHLACAIKDCKGWIVDDLEITKE